ncbi:EamA family transporter [Arthrobacter sp. StoSoilB20]|uniref:EamA family transporter n=1 Tax=Arthrobacter sp. StoSoilB20 TaxID=2830995 RepID=UPI001CC8256F|nr:EamA family transporter [Arthrobacter sp. StoSoilB20]
MSSSAAVASRAGVGASKATPRDLFITALAPMVWGSTYLVTTEFLPADRPLLAATVRALPAGIVLMVVTRTWPRGSWWFKAAALGALNIGLFFFLLFFTAYQLPGGLAALVMSIQPLFVLFLGVLLLGERIRMAHIIACGVGAAGVGLLVLRSDATLTLVGVLAGMAAALSMAAGIVLTKRWGRPDGVGLLGFTGLQLAMGGVMLLPVTLVVEGLPASVSGPNLAGFAYLSVIGALAAYAVWFRGIERLPTMVVSFLGFLSPLVATALGFVFLGESLSGWQLVGAALVLGAVGLVQRPGGGWAPPTATRSGCLHVGQEHRRGPAEVQIHGSLCERRPVHSLSPKSRLNTWPPALMVRRQFRLCQRSGRDSGSARPLSLDSLSVCSSMIASASFPIVSSYLSLDGSIPRVRRASLRRWLSSRAPANASNTETMIDFILLPGAFMLLLPDYSGDSLLAVTQPL